MKNMKKIPQRSSIFTRLFLVFLLILIPMIFIGIRIYEGGVKAVKDELKAATFSRVGFFVSTLEDDITRIQLLQLNLLDNIFLQRLTTMDFSKPNYDRDMNIVRVQSSLDAIKNSSRYIDEVSVILPDKDRKISSLSYGTLTEDEHDFISTAAEQSEAVIHQSERGLYIVNTFPFVRAENQVLVILSTIEFSEERLQEAMLVYSGGGESGALLFNRERDFFLSSGNNVKLVNHISANPDLMEAEGNNQIVVDGTGYLISSAYSSVLDLHYLIYTPEGIVFQKAEGYKRTFWIFAATALVVMAAFFYLSYQVVHRPLSRLVKAFSRVEKGELDVTMDSDSTGEFGYIMDGFNTMVGNLKALIDQSYTQKILVQKSELKQLQAQINPHFLYNSFFILRRWIKQGDVENADQFSKYLGIYLQYIARSDSDEAPLSREIEHARIYAEIQAMRFSNRISMDFEELPPEYCDLSVPRLIVQPVIENAFQYGLEDKVSGGRLKISFTGDDITLVIDIEDNGSGLSDAQLSLMQNRVTAQEEHQTTGLINIHKRIVLLFGTGSGVFFSRSAMGGLRVSLRIKFKNR